MTRRHRNEPHDADELGPRVAALGRLSYSALMLEYVDATRKMLELDALNRHPEGLYHRDFVMAMRWAIIVGMVLNDADPEAKTRGDS